MDKREDDLDRELQSHLDLEAEEQGDPHAARKALGNLGRVKEDVREAWGWVWLERLGQDLRYALRTMRQSPGFTATAVLSLALGIGANTSIFHLFDALILRSLPVRSPQELVVMRQSMGDFQTMMLSTRHREAFAASDALSGLCASRHSRLRITRSGESQLAEGMLASGNCFSLLGVSADVGRMITEADDQASSGALVAVLSYGYWQREFGADRNVIGQTIDLQGRLHTIIGVAPPGFIGLEPGTPADVIVPLTSQGGPLLSRPDAGWLRLLGRRKPDVSIEQVQADLVVRLAHLTQNSKGKGKAATPRLEVVAAGSGFGEARNEFSVPMRILMGAVALVLLIACSNLASLLLARAGGRRQEIDLRIALGAGRARLFRQLLTESVLLSSLGGILALGIAWSASPLLVRAMSRGRAPIVLDLSLDWRALMFTAAVSLLTGVLFGIVPALRAIRQRDAICPQHGARLKTGSRRWSAVLIVSQVALCMIVLVSAGLLLGSLHNLQQVDAGFRKDRILLVGIRPGMSNYRGPRSALLHRELYTRLSALPGVQSVTLSAQPPLGGLAITTKDFSINSVGPRFFETMGIPLLAGREINDRDDAAAPAVVVISESVAQRMFADRNPLGQRVDVFGAQSEVVGVVKDAHYQDLRQPAEPMAYRPYLQTGDADLVYGIRTTGDPEALTSLVRRELREVAHDVPVFSLNTLEARVDASLVRERMVSNLSTLFGCFALLIASIGLYGRLSYSVAERTGEIGVRMALGARQGSVIWMVLRDALLLTASGIAIGLPLALASTRAIRSLLFGMAAADLSTYTMIVVAILGVTILAGYIPARRAANVDPMTALRHQ